MFGDLAVVQQAVGARKDLNEGAEIREANDLAQVLCGQLRLPYGPACGPADRSFLTESASAFPKSAASLSRFARFPCRVALRQERENNLLQVAIRFDQYLVTFAIVLDRPSQDAQGIADDVSLGLQPQRKLEIDYFLVSVRIKIKLNANILAICLPISLVVLLPLCSSYASETLR